MSSLTKKIDFAIIIAVNNANPNGDPINGNMPRTTIDGIGEITDVCLKRKIRNYIQDLTDDNGNHPHSIFVQSEDRKIDGESSLASRVTSDTNGLGKNCFDNTPTFIKSACDKWFDVRAFGQLFAFKKGKSAKKAKKTDEQPSDTDDNSGSVSVGIRGPLTLQPAFSVERVNITSTQITKSVNGEDNKEDASKKSSDTMGFKHRVDSGIYVTFGAISPMLASKTGFSDDDAELIKSILPRIFEGDASSARPEGSMRVLHLIWWEHNSAIGQYSSGKVHHSLIVNPDGSYTIEHLDGLIPQEIEGF